MSPSPPVLDRVGTRLRRLSMRAEAVRLRLSRRVTLTERVEAESGDPDDWSFLRRPAILGFIAVVSICLGASLPSSPFKLEMGGTWFFGEANWPSTTLMLPGVVAVYGGMILFVRVWFGLYQTLRARPGVPIRQLAYMLALWILPLLVVAPLFSRDVFSYAAQGEMMSHHINPYHYGPGTIGSGPYVSGVDPLWVEHARPLRPALLDAGRLVGLAEPPPRAGHRPAAAPAVGGRRRADRLLHPQAGPLLRPRPRPGLRAGRAQPADPAGPGGRRAQRRHHGGPAPGRRHRGAVAPPGVGRRPVRAGRLHQGAGGHGHRLRGVGLGRAVGADWRRRARMLVARRASSPWPSWGSSRSCRGSAGAGSPTWARPAPCARGWPRPPRSAS